MKPRFPIYIVSRGRWKNRLTARALEEMNVPYYIIVDASEYDQYCSVIDKKKVLIQPQKYYDDYDMFWKDNNKVTGPGAARNFAWDHSIQNGHKWHWVMDDNIAGFARLNRNKKLKVTDGAIFRAMEDFCLRYQNVALAGPHYRFFCDASAKVPAFEINTRVYSCILIRNDIPYRWRGRYNEDTDLSIRVLKDGWCTIQFFAFLQNKVGTQILKGGNTEQFYSKEGTYNKSKMLYDMHPDVTRLAWRFNRCHHYVDYRKFRKNLLKRKPNVRVSRKTNEYGMSLVNVPRKSRLRRTTDRDRVIPTNTNRR